MNKSQSKKRKKKYYLQCSKRQKQNALTVGIKGVLITCNGNEKQCTRETYNILNEYGDKLYGSEMPPVEMGEKNIEDELEMELTLLKNQKIGERRFQRLNTKIKNCLFIKTEVADPHNLVYSIFDDVQKSQTQKTRYILRMLPILATCKSYVENIQKTITELLDKFTDADLTDPTYAIIFKSRHNNSINKAEVISAIYDEISKQKPNWKANVKDFQLAIIVEILQTTCCLGITKDYLKFRKYNLAEIVSSSSSNSLSVKSNEETEIKQDNSEPLENVVLSEIKDSANAENTSVIIDEVETKDVILSADGSTVANKESGEGNDVERSVVTDFVVEPV